MKLIRKEIINHKKPVPVYDLHMDNEENPNFTLENGLVVHNCHFDYSQMELVTLACMSGDENMIKAFADGKDIHKFVASLVFQKPEDEISSSERRVAKTVGFSLIYGKSVQNVANDITSGNVKRAQELFDTFYKSFPKIRNWMDDKVREGTNNNGQVTNMFGSKLNINMDEPGGGPVRKMINAPIQSTASVVGGTAMSNFVDNCEVSGLYNIPIGFTHDAYDGILKSKDLIEYCELLKKVCQEDIKNNLNLPIKLDLEIGVDAGGLCEIDFTKVDNNVYEIHLEGNKADILNIVSRLGNKVTAVQELGSKTTKHSYEEMFTTGTAVLEHWGKTITKSEYKITYNQ